MHVKLHKIMFIILPEKGYLNKDEILMKLARLKWNIRTYLKGRLACKIYYTQNSIMRLLTTSKYHVQGS